MQQPRSPPRALPPLVRSADNQDRTSGVAHLFLNELADMRMKGLVQAMTPQHDQIVTVFVRMVSDRQCWIVRCYDIVAHSNRRRAGRDHLPHGFQHLLTMPLELLLLLLMGLTVMGLHYCQHEYIGLQLLPQLQRCAGSAHSVGRAIPTDENASEAAHDVPPERGSPSPVSQSWLEVALPFW
jgi:hypothetical protein